MPSPEAIATALVPARRVGPTAKSLVALANVASTNVSPRLSLARRCRCWGQQSLRQDEISGVGHHGRPRPSSRCEGRNTGVPLTPTLPLPVPNGVHRCLQRRPKHLQSHRKPQQSKGLCIAFVGRFGIQARWLGASKILAIEAAGLVWQGQAGNGWRDNSGQG